MQYSDDNDEHFPPPQRWSEVTAPYAKDRDGRSDPVGNVWKCPAASSRYGYALNANLPRECADLSAPTNFVMLFESDASTRSALGGPNQLSTPRHVGGNNFAFGNGHVRFLRTPDVQWVNKPN